MPSSLRPILILGPTAGGKSELAVRLCESLATTGGAQIVNADSMQVYRHMDAGTAKPSPQQRSRALHHLIDIVEPDERFTVADWAQRADAIVDPLLAQGITPIVVGGTNLYIKIFLEGMFEGPPMDPSLRANLQQQAPADLHRRLQDIDPAAADAIHPNDMKRLVRALEVHQLTGRRISDWQTQWDEPEAAPSATGALQAGYRRNPLLFVLDWPVELINQRINLRVKAMFFPQDVPADLAAEVTPAGQSIVEETRRLLDEHKLGEQARKALGYQQVIEHLQGRCSVDDAFEQTKIQTRQFARKQRTWLKRFRGLVPLPASQMSPQQLADAVLARL